MSKAIYTPKGKAGEYAKYAVNFYVGCSNDCTYCYCKRGVLGHAMGAPTPTLKKCFKDYMHATDVFRAELEKNIEEYRKHGLFFTFTSDPCLEKTRFLTWTSVDWAIQHGVPCKVLTKRADFIDKFPPQWKHEDAKKLIAWGFTLTGHDELEPGASSNAERIEAMERLHEMGFKTFASIEPVVSIEAALEVIEASLGSCDLYKIGLLSGKREYSMDDVFKFKCKVDTIIYASNVIYQEDVKVYWKDSVLDYIGMKREALSAEICVGADYNIFQ